MHQRVALARAPQAARRVLGEGFTPLVPHTLFAMRRSGLLARLLAEQPDGWFPGGWAHEMEEAFHLVERRLRVLHGDETESWTWGTVRPLTLRHALGDRAPLGAVFNRGPFPIGGDGDTIAQASPDPADPTSGTTVAIASLRMAIDVGDWERCRWVLPGGQSGNPFSPHYDDQLTLWREGDALPIQWSEAAVAGATHRTLTIHPPELPDA
jgi:penicillin amidase